MLTFAYYRRIFTLILVYSYWVNDCVDARKHHLVFRNDIRPYIALNNFGYFTGGHLDVKLSMLNIEDEQPTDLFGLSLDKTAIDQMNPYLDSHQNKCILEEGANVQRSGPIIFFLLDLLNLQVKVNCSYDWKNFHIYSDSSMATNFRNKRDIAPHDDSGEDNDKSPQEPIKAEQPNNVVKDASAGVAVNNVQKLENSLESQKQLSENSARKDITISEHSAKRYCEDLKVMPLIKFQENGKNYYNMSFSMFVASLPDEGLYNLFFHSCPNYKLATSKAKAVSFNVDIEGKNNGSFLSAGEMPLPALYFMMSLLLFLSGLFWVFILKKSKHSVYKIHYLMALLVFLKSLSLSFHSINYHFIEVRGEHVEAWAILYYITHLFKGAVLFITIVLIGTGWTFIKHILSDKDKKIFMIVIPLQVLANVAKIIIDESEESDIEFTLWRNIFVFVDLLCCVAILFPIVWSIRHLHEASATDGKAAINLRKLKLFRQFYIMIVCYIYFTRIIVYLLKMTVAFQYAWLDEMFREMATYVFFVLTGYKFRPASSHPYFPVSDEDPEDDITEVLTESGLTEGLHRTKALNRNAILNTSNANTTTIIDEERENLVTKRESSHEYD